VAGAMIEALFPIGNSFAFWCKIPLFGAKATFGAKPGVDEKAA